MGAGQHLGLRLTDLCSPTVPHSALHAGAACSVLASSDILFASTGVINSSNPKWRAEVFPFGSRGGRGPLLPALAQLRRLTHLDVAHPFAGLETGLPDEWCRSGSFPSLSRWRPRLWPATPCVTVGSGRTRRVLCTWPHASQGVPANHAIAAPTHGCKPVKAAHTPLVNPTPPSTPSRHETSEPNFSPCRLRLSARSLGAPLPDIQPGALPALGSLQLELPWLRTSLPASWGADPAVLPALEELKLQVRRQRCAAANHFVAVASGGMPASQPGPAIWRS